MSRRSHIAALVGSRICHDLVNPLGAIGNGVELLSMTGAAEGQELDLITESVANAQARLRFLRIAFGHAEKAVPVSRSEILSILRDAHHGGRIGLAWEADGDPSRAELRLAFLALQCLESAMPRGGHIRVRRFDDRWEITAEAERFDFAEELWAGLADQRARPHVTARDVQFLLLPEAAAEAGRPIAVDRADGRVEVRV